MSAINQLPYSVSEDSNDPPVIQAPVAAAVAAVIQVPAAAAAAAVPPAVAAAAANQPPAGEFLVPHGPNAYNDVIRPTFENGLQINKNNRDGAFTATRTFETAADNVFAALPQPVEPVDPEAAQEAQEVKIAEAVSKTKRAMKVAGSRRVVLQRGQGSSYGVPHTWKAWGSTDLKKVWICHGRVFETKKVMNVWKANFMNALGGVGVDMETAVILADAAVKDYFARMEGLRGADINAALGARGNFAHY